MTCVIGVADGSGVYMGADSAGVSGWDLCVRADPKVFQNGPMLFGFTSSFRMGQLLEYNLTVPLHDPELTNLRYLVSVFIPAVRDCLKTGGFATVENQQESGGTFLIGYHGAIYGVESDFQVAESVEPWMAVGCGAAYAYGALAATRDVPPAERIRRALSIAERYSAGVRGPFNVRTLERCN